MLIALTVIFLIMFITAIIYIFLIMPRVSDRALMDILTTDYAHRGFHSQRYPENSLPAFSAAISRGYGIELDVRLTCDGQVVVFHDTSLKRMCGIDKKISEMSAIELKRTHLRDTRYTIPTLPNVLALVDGRVPLLIEIKDTEHSDKLCRAVSVLLDTYGGAFAIQSFDPRVLGWFKRYRPRFARGQLVTKLKTVSGKKHPRLTATALSGMLTNFISRPDFISVNAGHTRALSVRVCHLLFKCRALVWTVRDQKLYTNTHKRGMLTIFEGFVPD
ncbi:MAG: glycerophosphodiester phosphodiesterase [Clostridia bacterium]|nr:glycerophosphodiester phosphodiesterase [Clostridia bacterium]